jgi:hypothetical protein
MKRFNPNNIVLVFILLSVLIGQFSFAACEVPGANGAIQNEAENKKNCLKAGKFVLDILDSKQLNFQKITNSELKNTYITDGADVYCRFQFQKQNGASAKFRCALTNEKNQFYDSKGNLIPEAKSLKAVDDDVMLLDENGQVIPDVKARILKVRYSKNDGRNVENYSSAGTSRILKAIGVPAHTNIVTNQIVCFGCSEDPFRDQKAPLTDRKGQFQVSTFKDAVIEIKFKGKRIYDPEHNPWSWAELLKLGADGELTADQKIQIEVFGLASQFLGFISDDAFQNAIVCNSINKSSPHICDEVTVMTHDIGAGLGKRYDVSRGLFGSKSRPRANLKEWAKAQVFKPGTCEFNYQSSNGSTPVTVSKEARDEFIRRAEILTEQNLMAIFKSSRISNLTAKSAEEVKEHDMRWTEATLKKIEEIKNAPCK